VAGTLNLLEVALIAGHDRFAFISITSVMISQTIQHEESSAAARLTEDCGPLAPRDIYGVTKLAAEGPYRIHHLEHGLNCIILRTARFFPEEDDTHRKLSGLDLKANEFLNRRLAHR
jgi:UDP-glucose 4-epimerase